MDVKKQINQSIKQATAVSVTLDREITICSVYIPLSFALNYQHLDNLLQHFSSLFILLGDFNGHNILWGGQNNDSIGELIKNFITKNDICIMNDKSYTYYSPSTKSFTSIDLSFCHPSLFLDYNWSVCEDQHNSDHFSINIEQNTFSTEDHNPKWKLNRADWDLFNALCTGKLIPESFRYCKWSLLSTIILQLIIIKQTHHYHSILQIFTFSIPFMLSIIPSDPQGHNDMTMHDIFSGFSEVKMYFCHYMQVKESLLSGRFIQ